MPFNGSGAYSLSDTIAAGTPNDATELQAILDDIATGLSNAVCVDGQSTMTGVLSLPNGSAAAPSYTFGSDTNTGAYRYGADQYGIAVNGSAVGYFASTGWNGAVVGNVTGNVTGNLTGNVTGNVTGDVTGTASGNPPNSRTITAGTGLSGGGTLAADRTLSLATSGVSAGTYYAPTITVDVYGRITTVANSGDSAVRARGTLNTTGNTWETGSVNLSASVTNSTTGTFVFSFSSALASANYQVFFCGDTVGVSGYVTSKTTSGFTLVTFNTATGAAQEPGKIDLVVYGGF